MENQLNVIFLIYTKIEFGLVKQNRFAKTSKLSEEKDPPQVKNILNLQIILQKMQKIL